MRVTDKFVFFWQDYLSNWARIPGGLTVQVNNEDVKIPTSEHLFMLYKAQYFKDTEAIEKIVKSSTPKEAKAVGRSVKNFNAEKWDKVSPYYMTKAVTIRYQQDKKFADMLTDKKYEGKTFVEASPYDKIWGIGMKEDDPDVEDKSKWQGENKLGKCLTTLRNKAISGSIKESSESIGVTHSLFHDMWLK